MILPVDWYFNYSLGVKSRYLTFPVGARHHCLSHVVLSYLVTRVAGLLV